MSSSLPGWLAAEIALRSGKGVLVRSETVAEMHERVRVDQGLVWNSATQSWENES